MKNIFDVSCLMAAAKDEIRNGWYAFRQKGSFVRDLSHVFAGKILVVLFSLVTTPFLTRLYTPEAYGYFSFFNTVATNFAMLATLGFPFALVIAKSEREFYNLFVSLLIIVALFLLLFASVLFLFIEHIVPFEFVHEADQQWYYVLLILGSSTFAFVQILPRWNVWRNQFRIGSGINVVVQAGARSMSLAIGFFFNGYRFGLIIGDVLGKAIGLGLNFWINVRKEFYQMVQLVRGRYIWGVLRMHKNYPRYILSAGYLGTLTQHIPLLIFSFYFSADLLGSYALAAGLLAMPGTLVAQPLASVFVKKATELQGTDESRVSFFVKRLVLLLFVPGVLLFAVIVAFAPYLFIWGLGEKWATAGTYASVLAIYGTVELICLSIQNILQVLKKQKLFFRLNLLLLGLVLISILPGWYWHDAISVIWGIAIARTIGFFVILYYVLRVCNVAVKEILFQVIVAFSVVMVVSFVVNNLLSY